MPADLHTFGKDIGFVQRRFGLMIEFMSSEE